MSEFTKITATELPPMGEDLLFVVEDKNDGRQTIIGHCDYYCLSKTLIDGVWVRGGRPGAIVLFGDDYGSNPENNYFTNYVDHDESRNILAWAPLPVYDGDQKGRTIMGYVSVDSMQFADFQLLLLLL